MQVQEVFGANSSEIMATAVALAAFSYIYNRFVDFLHRKGWNDGYVWLEVVIGTAVTLLAAIPTIGLENAIVLFLYFASSGFFMAAGDMFRHIKAREDEKHGVEHLVNEMEELND